MKNLFDYATKELSQDAFLRWLFESFNGNEDEKFKKMVCDFIAYFTKGQKDERKPLELDIKDITKIKTFAQYDDTDVSIDIYSDRFENTKYKTIVIEDKTGSEEHNQLKKYNDKIDKKWKYGSSTPIECVYKVFYKTSTLNKTERERVKAANWTPFYLDSIYDFFIKYKHAIKSDVLNDYIDHIEKMMEDATYDELPNENNILRWKSFLEKKVEPILKDGNSKYDTVVWDTFYGYAYLNVRPFGSVHNETPYLEIRSRDCLGDNFKATILLYNLKEEYLKRDSQKIKDLKEIISNSPIFKKENYAKQIASTKYTIKNMNEVSFANEIVKVSEEYLRIIREWQNGVV